MIKKVRTLGEVNAKLGIGKKSCKIEEILEQIRLEVLSAFSLWKI